MFRLVHLLSRPALKSHIFCCRGYHNHQRTRESVNSRELAMAEDCHQNNHRNSDHHRHSAVWYTEESGHFFRLSREFIDKCIAGKGAMTGESANTLNSSFSASNGLGELVYKRTYARYVPELGRHEEWPETVQRVVEGTFTIRKRWLLAHHTSLGWDEDSNRNLAERMFKAIYAKKFLPPGRGLWAMGSALTKERHLFASLHNCKYYIYMKDLCFDMLDLYFDLKDCFPHISPPHGLMFSHTFRRICQYRRHV